MIDESIKAVIKQEKNINTVDEQVTGVCMIGGEIKSTVMFVGERGYA